MTSYDVKALFISVPMDPSINIVRQNLQQNPLLSQRTNMSIPQTITLMEFHLKNTYFLFQGKYYKQVHGAVMGSPLTPLLPACLWKSLKSRPLAVPHFPNTWLRYVDDTFVIQEAEHSQQLLQHINSQNPHVQFTVKEPNQEGALSFFDTVVSPGPNNTLVTTVYRKLTNTDHYLHWDRNHFITAKKWCFQHFSI